MCEDIWKLQNVNVTKWEVSIILLRKLYELSMGVVHVDVHRQSWLFEVVKPSFEQNGPMERGHPPESPSCRCPSEFGSKKLPFLVGNIIFPNPGIEQSLKAMVWVWFKWLALKIRVCASVHHSDACGIFSYDHYQHNHLW